MRHLKATRKLGLDTAHRMAMLRNMVDSMIVSGRIKITVTRAKELRKLADRMITYSKKNTLHTKRMALKILRTKDAFTKLFSDEYREQFMERSGGYTRIIKLGARLGDNAPMAYIEFVTETAESKSTSTGRKRRRKSKTASDTSVNVETKNSVKETVVENAKVEETKVNEVKEAKEVVETEVKEDVTETEKLVAKEENTEVIEEQNEEISEKVEETKKEEN